MKYAIALIVLSMNLAMAANAQSSFEPTKKWHGFIQTDYYNGKNYEKPEQDSTFHIRRARLGIKGLALPGLKYNVLAAYDGADSTPAEVKAFNVFVKYGLSESWSLTAGQFKYSFDREGRPAAHKNPFIYFSLPTQKIVGKLGAQGSAFRDVGIELKGHFRNEKGHETQLFLGLINGNGINRTDSGDGNQDSYFRLTHDLGKSFNVGGSYYQGKIINSASEGYLDETIWTADAQYQIDRWKLLTAVFSGDYEQSVGHSKKPYGYYLAAVYRHSEKVEFAFRRQMFDEDQNSSDKKVSSWDYGVNFYLGSKGLTSGTRLSLNYLSRSAQSGGVAKLWHDRGPKVIGENVGNLLAARIQVLF